MLEEARAELRPAVREGLYRKFEHGLLDSGILVPLFHDVDYRVANPRCGASSSTRTAPYVNYADLGKATAPAAPVGRRGPDRRRRPARSDRRASCGASTPSLTATVEQADVLPSIFETLTWAAEGTRIVPWLAAETS